MRRAVSPAQGLEASEAARQSTSGPGSAAPFPRSRRDRWVSLLLGLLCLLVYNANLRSIPAGDTYAARYLPFGIWRYHTVLLDPILTITAQGRRIFTSEEQRTLRWKVRTDTVAFWIVRGRENHALSLYPVVVPLAVAPLYLPAVVYLHFHAQGWDQPQLDRIARIMEKIAASLLAALSAALLYLLLRRRAELHWALLLTLAFAFGTTTWVISSQALWQHGLAELLIVGMLLAVTGPCTSRSAVAAGVLCGLIACNRPPDSILAVALGLYSLRWAGRLAPRLMVAAALPVAVVVAYNLGIAGNLAGAYGLVGDSSFFQFGLLSGLAGLLFSPTRGLFVFSPFLLFLPFCLPQALRDRGTRGLTITMGIAVVLQVLLYAKADWRQGASWGPRWLTDLLPILLWMLPPIVSTLRSAGRFAFVLACCAAMAIEAVGAFWYTGASDEAIFAAAAKPDQMRAAWNLRNAPFLAELRHAPAPAELALGLRGSFDSMMTSDGDVREIAAGKEINVAGWAVADGHSPREVLILLDGHPAASNVNFSPRDDVTRTLGYTSPSGWSGPIATHELTPGEHVLAVLVRAKERGALLYLTQRRFTVLAHTGDGGDLALNARLATALLSSRQQAPGYWLTSFTNQLQFQNPHLEMNTFLTSLMVDVLNPVAGETGLVDHLKRARQHLSAQIEAGGLVRYHGLPDAPTIGTLGCAITPDADDTALVWRIAPGPNPERLPLALAALGQYRTPEGLYRTWLAPRDRYQCIDPGKDPNPADAGIQMHVLMLLAQADPPAAHALCRALGRALGEDRIWVYYRTAPLLPILRQADLQMTGCPLQLPPSRLQSAVTGQDAWLEAGQLLQRLLGAGGPAPASAEVVDLLRRLSRDDFAFVRQSPPLFYHNDLTASLRRFYWSPDLGYALWLRLYFENARHHSVGPASGGSRL
jgi:hypothetical protein